MTDKMPDGRHVRQRLSLFRRRISEGGLYPFAISLSCTVILLMCVVIAYR